MRLLKLFVAASALIFTGLQPLVATAQEGVVPDDSAVPLIEQLRDSSPERAETLADQVRREWSASGSATADYLLTRGRKAMERDDPQSAIEHFTAVIDHAPEFAQGWAERARAYYDLEHVLALNPNHFEAIMGLAVILDSMNRAEDAYEAYRQVEAIHPHQPGLTEALQRLEPMVRGSDL
ncbi:tetratricopeptide repeat protein [Roseobacter sp.]|uniref:tetratricopeptide repeat protein n=1 Tax=Roseobacter sp. TaxID=1907202 RepID=UPI0032972996